ncbi:MAG: MFS transporter [Firmicutes bacterium]|nr:MFS transporter [Bacillota bacterium]
MNVEKKLDDLPLTGAHYRIIAVSGLGTLFDSMDVGIISFVLAALIGAWHLHALMIGIVGSISLVGMAIGAVLSGLIADKVGRRAIYMTTLLVYSLATGLSALSWSVLSLIILRFIVGLGLGGELPVTSTLVTEFLPEKQRGRGIVLLESFWAVGWIVAALVAYLLIPHWGWRIAFVVGAVPALYVLYLRRNVPESPRYLEKKGRHKEAVQALRSLGVKLDDTADPGRDEKPVPVPKGALWTARYRKRTIMLWILWLGMNFAYYGMFLWLPSVMVDHGFSLVNSLKYTLIVTIAQLPGYFSAAWLVEKWGRKLVLVVYASLSAVAAGLFGYASSSAELVVFGSLLSFFNLGAWGVTYAYTVEQYPTVLRASGSGVAMGFGRIGGIIGPLIVGMMLSAHWPMIRVFGLFAAVLLVVAISVGVMGKETKGLGLEAIEEM